MAVGMLGNKAQAARARGQDGDGPAWRARAAGTQRHSE
jgi:hypothetical protein